MALGKELYGVARRTAGSLTETAICLTHDLVLRVDVKQEKGEELEGSIIGQDFCQQL
jgi:hypothetical protein